MDTGLLESEPSETVLIPKPYKRRYMMFVALAAIFALVSLILLIVVLVRQP